MAVNRTMSREQTYPAWFATRDELLKFFTFAESLFGDPPDPSREDLWTNGTVAIEVGADARAVGLATEVLEAIPARRIQALFYRFPEDWRASERVSITLSQSAGIKIVVTGSDPSRVHGLLAAIGEEAKHFVPWWRIILRGWFVPVSYILASAGGLLLGTGIARHLHMSSTPKFVLSLTFQIAFMVALAVTSSEVVCPRFQVLTEGQSPRGHMYLRTIVGVLSTSIIGAVVSLAIS